MNPIELFLELLRQWRDRGAVTFDDDAVHAPHAAVSAFDLDAFGQLADTLRRQSGTLHDAVSALTDVGAEVPQSWTGSAATAVQTAASRLAVDLVPTAEAVARHAASVTAARDVLSEVLDDYRTTMSAATDPLAAGLALPEARAELNARLELAAEAGRAASAAVDDSIAVLGDEWRSAGDLSGGELVLAGDR